ASCEAASIRSFARSSRRSSSGSKSEGASIMNKSIHATQQKVTLTGLRYKLPGGNQIGIPVLQANGSDDTMKSKRWDEALLSEHRGYLISATGRAVFDEMTLKAVESRDY